MKQNLMNEVIQGMLPFLNNGQMERLQEVLQHTLFNYKVVECDNNKELSEQNLVELFLAAKRIEGCSEKSLKYYESTILALLDDLGKDVKHIVTDDTARTMLANSEFVIMLNQASTDRIKLAELLNISDTQLSYITNVEAGRGLMKVGSALVPFVNKFPKNTKLYALMTTKFGER